MHLDTDQNAKTHKTRLKKIASKAVRCYPEDNDYLVKRAFKEDCVAADLIHAMILKEKKAKRAQSV